MITDLYLTNLFAIISGKLMIRPIKIPLLVSQSSRNIFFLTYQLKVLFISYIDKCDMRYAIVMQNFGSNTHLRSAIFCSTEEERKQAQQSKIRRQMKLNRRILTKINLLSKQITSNCEFFVAENQHQKYYLQKHYRLCESLSLRSTEQFVESYLACKLNGYVNVLTKSHDNFFFSNIVQIWLWLIFDTQDLGSILNKHFQFYKLINFEIKLTLVGFLDFDIYISNKVYGLPNNILF